MNELTLDGKIYVSSKRAAEMTGYAKDYVGQLCREGRVEARLVGRNWYILKTAIERHRFASDAIEKDVSEPIAKDLTADTWVHPTYKEEERADVPTIDQVDAEDSPEEEPTAPEATTMEAMQDAWRGWFNQIESTEEPAEEAEIAPEAPEEPESIETAIPLRSMESTREQPEVLNLRRIREYQPKEVVEEREAVIISETIIPRGTGSAGYYRTIQAVCVVIALMAVGIAYIGSGFAGSGIISHKPASSIAGVSVYNKAQ